MTTALRTYRDAIATLLTTDATFVAAVGALVGVAVTTVLKSNRPTGEIPEGLYPCWVIEAGDGQAASIDVGGQDYQTIGLSQQAMVMDLWAVLIWMDGDRDHAADTRLELPYLLTQLLLRNPQPGGCEQAVFNDWQPDRGANFPTQIWRARIVSDHAIPRTG